MSGEAKHTPGLYAPDERRPPIPVLTQEQADAHVEHLQSLIDSDLQAEVEQLKPEGNA